MNQSSKIYIAGHRGLVGSALVRKLQAEGFTQLLVRSRTELDLTNQTAVGAFFDSERPEYVFLAAGKVGGIGGNSTYKADFIYENLVIATNVIHAAYEHGTKKLLNLGSSCIYPRLAPQPIKEDYLLTGPLESTNEPYAIAKIAAIKLCRYYNEQYGTDFISVMPTNLYGPNDNFNLETSHVLPALLRKFQLAKLLREDDLELLAQDLQMFPIGYGLDATLVGKDRKTLTRTLERLGITAEELVLWGSGTPYREFLHVDDLADACVFLMERYDAKDLGELVNIGTGKDMTIADMASIIKELVGFEGGVRFDSSKPDGTPRKLLDVTKLRNLGWDASIPLREGLRKTLAWYVERYRTFHDVSS